MNIHLVDDEKFINKSYKTFEYYYPGQNIFFVQVSKRFDNQFRYIKKNANFSIIQVGNKSSITSITQSCNEGDNIFIHHLTPFKALVALKILRKKNVKIYWILYGADLYGLLQRKSNYKLYDEPTSKRKVDLFNNIKLFGLNLWLGYFGIDPVVDLIKKLNYFCFWNYYDYLLLINNFKTKAQWKYFRYFHLKLENINNNFENDKHCIVVNHSASLNGNHNTVLNKLHEIEADNLVKKIILPLSYGSRSNANKVIEYGKKFFKDVLVPLKDFMPEKDYFRIMRKAGVAIFGHRRQEGGNNIYFFLGNGTKLFLRRDNNLLKHLKDKGYHVFEFESDLNSIEDLSSLTMSEKEHNKKLMLAEFSKEAIDNTYINLLN